ncbi:MAG: hypoxanthine phosphoribosyltransferase, partial [Candidatus Omnitrophica bacterium]|nr:hypoxanthine phosphoribosyltransferase [Candidatus Omnitrophota bacterium]
SGKIKIDFLPSLKKRDVLLVEDIIDTGLTINSIKKEIKKQKPKSLKLCSLLDKPARRKQKVEIDYLGFEVPDKFLVGYGLDYKEKFRNLPYVGICPVK